MSRIDRAHRVGRGSISDLKFERLPNDLLQLQECSLLLIFHRVQL